MSLISVQITEGAAIVRLNDPDRRNALNAGMVAELSALMDDVEADESVRAVIITGEPPAFCAGADLSELGSSQRTGLLRIYAAFMRIGESPLPTIAAVNGAAVGAGLNLALACDLRIAGESATFDTRFLRLGLHPGGGHTWMYRRITSLQTASAAVLFGQVMDGREAERVGLVYRCVTDDHLLDHCTRMTRTLFDVPLELIKRTKATIQDMARIGDHESAMERGLRPQLWSLNQPAFKERLEAMRSRISDK